MLTDHTIDFQLIEFESEFGNWEIIARQWNGG